MRLYDAVRDSASDDDDDDDHADTHHGLILHGRSSVADSVDSMSLAQWNRRPESPS